MPMFKQLLMIWAAAGNVLDWSLLEKTWKVPCGPVAVARLCHLVKGPQRLKRLRKLVNDALALRGLPTTRLTIIPVPIPEMVAPARRRFAEALGQVMPRQVVECTARSAPIKTPGRMREMQKILIGKFSAACQKALCRMCSRAVLCREWRKPGMSPGS